MDLLSPTNRSPSKGGGSFREIEPCAHGSRDSSLESYTTATSSKSSKLSLATTRTGSTKNTEKKKHGLFCRLMNRKRNKSQDTMSVLSTTIYEDEEMTGKGRQSRTRTRLHRRNSKSLPSVLEDRAEYKRRTQSERPSRGVAWWDDPRHRRSLSAQPLRTRPLEVYDPWMEYIDAQGEDPDCCRFCVFFLFS